MIIVFTCNHKAYAGARNGVCESYMVASAKAYGVPLGILFSIGLTETGKAGSLHPFAVNVSGKAYYPDSAVEAYKIFKKARQAGDTLIDLGCMQINHHYHSDQFNSVMDMLDAGKNVDYAARFLKRLYLREGSWTLAAARYHAGPDNLVAQKRYVCTVIENLVASGYGNWTTGSRSFCK